MQVAARAAESLQPGDTGGIHSLSGATARALLPQLCSWASGLPDQAMAYGLMPSQASPLRMPNWSPSAIQTALWSGSTWLRIELQVALLYLLACQKKITGRPWYRTMAGLLMRFA